MVMPNTWAPAPNFQGVSASDPPPPFQGWWGYANNAAGGSINSGTIQTSFNTGWLQAGSFRQTLSVSNGGIVVPQGIFSMALWTIVIGITPATSPATGTAFRMTVGPPAVSNPLSSSFYNTGIGSTIGDTVNVPSVLIVVPVIVDTMGAAGTLFPRVTHSYTSAITAGNVLQYLWIFNACPPIFK